MLEPIPKRREARRKGMAKPGYGIGSRTLVRTQQTLSIDGSLVKYDYGTANAFTDQIGRVNSVIVNLAGC